MTSTQEITRQKNRTVRRIIEHEGRTIRVEAVYGLAYIGDQPQYFSLTGSVWEKRENGRFPSEPDSGGQCVEEILAAFPWLALMAQVHLNNAVTGEPLYAVENAWFWFTADKHDSRYPLTYPKGYKEMTGAERAASYLSVDPSFFTGVKTKDQFSARVDLLRPTWAALARQVIEIYALEVPAELTDKQ